MFQFIFIVWYCLLNYASIWVLILLLSIVHCSDDRIPHCILSSSLLNTYLLFLFSNLFTLCNSYYIQLRYNKGQSWTVIANQLVTKEMCGVKNDSFLEIIVSSVSDAETGYMTCILCVWDCLVRFQ